MAPALLCGTCSSPFARAVWLSAVGALLLLGAPSAPAQTLPPQALHAKTVVVLNDTRVFAVQQGAEAELRRWGQLRVVSRIDRADVILSFRLRKAATGAPNPGEQVVLISASTRDSPAPFFRGSCEGAQTSAGHDCTVAFENRWIAEARRAGVDTH